MTVSSAAELEKKIQKIIFIENNANRIIVTPNLKYRTAKHFIKEKRFYLRHDYGLMKKKSFIYISLGKIQNPQREHASVFSNSLKQSKTSKKKVLSTLQIKKKRYNKEKTFYLLNIPVGL